MPRIPEYQRRINPNYATGYRRPRSTIEAEKYRQKAQEIAHERTIQSIKDQRTSQLINFVGDLTEAGGQYFNQLMENEAARQLTNAEVMVNKSFDDIANDLEDNPYEEKIITGTPNQPGVKTQELRHYSVWKEQEEKIKNDVLQTITNPRAKEIFEQRYQNMAYEFGKALQDDARSRMKQQQRVDLLNNMEYWTQKGNMKKVNEYLSAGQAMGLFTPEELDKLKDTSERTIKYNRTYSQAFGVLQARGLEEARKYLYSDQVPEGLNNEDISEMENALEAKWKEYQGQLNDQAFEDYRIGRLREEDLGDEGRYGSLSANKKEHWLDAIRKQNKAREKRELQEEYNAKYKTYKEGAWEIDVTDDREYNAFLKEADLSGLEDPDINAVKGIVKGRRARWKAQIAKEEELAEKEDELAEDLEKEALWEEYTRAHDHILLGYIDSVNELNDPEKYPELNRGTEEAVKALERLEGKFRDWKDSENPATKTDENVELWIVERWDNENIPDSEIAEYINAHEGNGLSNDDVYKWEQRLEKRTPDPVKKRAVDLINSEFDILLKAEDDYDQRVKLNKEKSLLLQRYNEWYEENKDEATEEDKINKVTSLLEPLKQRRTSKKIEDLRQRREAEEGVLGLNEMIDYYGSEPQARGKDKEGNPIFIYSDYSFRYNIKKDRLEFWDWDKEKWRSKFWHRR